MQTKRIPFHIGLAALALSQGSLVHAAGYQFGTQSARDQGSSNAGAAEATDASTIYYNPAGLTNVAGTTVTLDLAYVEPQSEFTYTTAQTGNPVVSTNVQPASNGGDFAKPVVVPHGYFSKQIDDKYTVGVGVFVPFGAKAEFSNDFAGRYYTRATDMKSVNINPTLAIKLSPQHSIGVGVSAQYMDATFDKNFNMQALGIGGCLSALGAACSGATLAGVSAAYGAVGDASVHVSGSDWGFGYNLGYMYQPDADTRIGIAYRSQIKQKLRGTAAFSVPTLPSGGALSTLSAGLNARLANADATVDLTTPDSLSAHGFKHLNGPWSIMGDVTWTRHSKLQTLTIKTPTAADPNRNITYATNWKDSYKVSIGASYDLNQRLTLRGGYMYDKSPVPDAEHALTTMPDNDRQWFSLGASYRLDKQNSFDVAYSYIKLKPTQINRTDDDYNSANGTPGTLTGQYKTHAQVISLQYSHAF